MQFTQSIPQTADLFCLTGIVRNLFCWGQHQTWRPRTRPPPRQGTAVAAAAVVDVVVGILAPSSSSDRSSAGTLLVWPGIAFDPYCFIKQKCMNIRANLWDCFPPGESGCVAWIVRFYHFAKMRIS